MSAGKSRSPRPVATPSPRSDGGEGRGEEVPSGRECPSPQSSPHSSLAGRGGSKAGVFQAVRSHVLVSQIRQLNHRDTEAQSRKENMKVVGFHFKRSPTG